MADLTAAEWTAISLAGCGGVLVIWLVIEVRVFSGSLRELSARRPPSTSIDPTQVEELTSHFDALRESNSIGFSQLGSLSEKILTSEHDTAGQTILLGKRLEDAISNADSAVEDLQSQFKATTENLAKLKELLSAVDSKSDAIAKQSEAIDEKIDERSRASLRRDRSYLASSYPRLLRIVSAKLDEAELREPTVAATKGESSGLRTSWAPREQSRLIHWKAKIAVLPLCENENCPTDDLRVAAIRACKSKEKLEYVIKDGSLFVSPELIASGGIFIFKVGMAFVPKAGLMWHALELAGISPALVEYVKTFVPGLFSTQLIGKLGREAVNNATEGLLDEAGRMMIINRIVAASDDQGQLPNLRVEIEDCLKRGRVAVLNVGGTAHLELGRLMEKEDQDGHVPFGGLVRILRDDGEYLWVCDECRRTHNAPPTQHHTSSTAAA